MKLKTRLIIAFFVIICVPISLTAVALVGFSRYQIRSLENNLGISGVTYETLSDSVQVLNKATQSNFEQIREKGAEDPDLFLDKEYLNRVNEELRDKYSFLIVRKSDLLYYSGSDSSVEKLFAELPENDDFSSQSDSGVYIGKDVKAFVKQVDLEFSDHTRGSVFIITSLTMIPQMRTLTRDVTISIIIILILTSGMLTMWIYNGISTPLKKLKVATQNIKEGNLDFVLDAEGDDEISELCRDFEEMRQRLRESTEEKIQYDKENKELISNIAHDLKTPITALKGYAEGIIDGVADTPEKMDRYIRTIYNKANDMDRLINELTFYSKIDTNRIPYTFNKINVCDYFDDCIEEVGLDLESKNIDLSYFNSVEKDVLIIADAEQLKRVINNIVGNSIKYMDKPKGYISIRVKDVGDFIQVEIEDNGRGIAAKDLPAIFDRFFRADASRNSSKGGSGIGLSIVRKIIEDHGGKIWANSKLGCGTIMYFVLRKYQEVPINE
ncbi:MAG: HAMP domain-containing sensor histidine kinase [Firmicutes bacterium]|nr:HAMP domain-containing sensor histidine kinase [Bacillota bacterium]